MQENAVYIYLIAAGLSLVIMYYIIKSAVEAGTSKLRETQEKIFELHLSQLSKNEWNKFWRNHKLRELEDKKLEYTDAFKEKRKKEILEKYPFEEGLHQE